MTHGSLFSGIGGFDLAAEWMGWDNIFHCEWNPFGQKVLKYHFPNSISYEDITKTDFSIHRGTIDILTGGFPCQPYSTAGKRLGKADERHLFPEMLRAIKEIKPRWIIGENVRGLVSWNGGMVFHEVHDDLEREGYEVQSFIIPAASVNAPHKRERIWFIANSRELRLEQCETSRTMGKRQEEVCREGNKPSLQFKADGNTSDATNTNCEGLERHRISRETSRKSSKQSDITSKRISSKDWSRWPTVSPVCNGDDGLSNRLDSITFPKWRTESIKAAGNAIVPQVAFNIFKVIETMENQL